ncbi:MAG: DNA polymerase III subunit gamma/tau, partial [Alphaproteobacteria bacterium]|nr:DNA polymerase III subunit gamma/tau [Alphaproteobacteria bacterium]
KSLDDVIELATLRKEGLLRGHLLRDVHLVRFEPGRIEFRPGEHAPHDLAKQLSAFLNRETGRTWFVAVSSDAGQLTVADQQAESRAAERARAAEHPLVKAVLETFPNARIEDVRAPRIEDAAEDLETDD